VDGKGCHGSPGITSILNNDAPPIFDGLSNMPLTRVDLMEAKPLLWALSNFNRQAAFEEKIGRGFLDLVTKFRKATISPSTLP
jgi:hypothetical protein